MSDTSGNGAAASGGALKGLGTLALLGIAYYIFFAQPNPVDVVASAVDSANSSASSGGNTFMEKVAKDGEDKYKMMQEANKSSHRATSEMCFQAGAVAHAYLDTKNQEKYEHWHRIEKIACDSAGLPT